MLPTTTESHSQLAYLALERKIVMLEIEPGTVVSEASTIELSGVGRTPAREALQRLALEGLVEIRPRAGIRIAEIRPDDFLNVLDVRRMLEPSLALLSTRFATGAQRRRVEECRQEMLHALAHSDTSAFLEADKAFDAALASACPNPYLSATLRPLQSHSRRFWFRFFADTGIEAAVLLHCRVMDHFVKGDAEAASGAMAALIEDMKKKAFSLRHDPVLPAQ
ncbi:GntR family transcriptional regulator [Devosia sp. RR2S18]|uniref:GntR family transcriptional regulator n=1 Tax=Devosia rhizosphaerae TaxID=3049774 RepID=UPI002540B2FE|nr:GntR family transcriptional regulator [Devosia sp. RR2S18]WIJ25105.1 GntR family transcriptional regulator [Devosia sp. RR2S18]